MVARGGPDGTQQRSTRYPVVAVVSGSICDAARHKSGMLVRRPDSERTAFQIGKPRRSALGQEYAALRAGGGGLRRGASLELDPGSGTRSRRRLRGKGGARHEEEASEEARAQPRDFVVSRGGPSA